jgi:N utilization substance protein B
LLYAAETHQRAVAEVMPGLARLTGPAPMVLDRAAQLATDVAANREQLDEYLAAATDHWRLERLAVVDRIILRIATQEIAAATVPTRVAIDEALWLAHRFGTARSAGFVNGVLDQLARNLGRL